MARTVDAVFAAPDPTAMLPALPIRSAEPRAIARGINKLNADGGDPPIRMGWTDGQFAHSGVLTEYQRYPIPEWSTKHTAQGLWCRVRTNVFGGANGKVRFESANSGAFVDVACGASAGWYDAATNLACSFVGGQDEIIVSVSTTSGTLTLQAISCVWPELPDPLDAGDLEGVRATYVVETGGVTLGAEEVLTDRESQALLTGAFVSITSGLIPDVEWKLKAGWMTVEAADIAVVAAAVAAHVRKTFAVERVVWEQIEALANEDLPGFDVLAAWAAAWAAAG